MVVHNSCDERTFLVGGKMTKKELLSQILEINGKIDDALSSVKSLSNDLKEMQTLIDDIPDEESEITDDETKTEN